MIFPRLCGLLLALACASFATIFKRQAGVGGHFQRGLTLEEILEPAEISPLDFRIAVARRFSRLAGMNPSRLENMDPVAVANMLANMDPSAQGGGNAGILGFLGTAMSQTINPLLEDPLEPPEFGDGGMMFGSGFRNQGRGMFQNIQGQQDRNSPPNQSGSSSVSGSRSAQSANGVVLPQGIQATSGNSAASRRNSAGTSDNSVATSGNSAAPRISRLGKVNLDALPPGLQAFLDRLPSSLAQFRSQAAAVGQSGTNRQAQSAGSQVNQANSGNSVAQQPNTITGSGNAFAQQTNPSQLPRAANPNPWEASQQAASTYSQARSSNPPSGPVSVNGAQVNRDQARPPLNVPVGPITDPFTFVDNQPSANVQVKAVIDSPRKTKGNHPPNTNNPLINSQRSSSNSQVGSANSQVRTGNSQQRTENSQGRPANSQGGTVNSQRGILNSQGGTFNSQGGRVYSPGRAANSQGGSTDPQIIAANTQGAVNSQGIPTNQQTRTNTPQVLLNYLQPVLTNPLTVVDNPPAVPPNPVGFEYPFVAPTQSETAIVNPSDRNSAGAPVNAPLDLPPEWTTPGLVTPEPGKSSVLIIPGPLLGKTVYPRRPIP